MQKIPTLFRRNDDHLVRNEVTPGAEWVIAGEGIATRKFDGTACLWAEGKLWKRRPVPRRKIPVAQEFDPIDGIMSKWLPVGDGHEDRWHREALKNFMGTPAEGATYELCGPKIQGNPERFVLHILVRHGCETLPYCPRNYTALLGYLSIKSQMGGEDIEGIVWYHPDGRMAKLKTRDFGITRGKERAHA